jgi:single-strand DNA-binding protein
MSEGLNRVQLLGNLGADPELRHTQGGNAVLNIRLATTETWLKDGEKQERTDWHNVVVWGKRAEALGRILAKGSQILVEGGLRTSSYDDKDGVKHWKTEIHATNILLCGRKPDGGDRQEQGRAERDTRAPSRSSGAGFGGGRSNGGGYGGSSSDDDIPF